MSSVLQSQPNELVTGNYWQEEDSPEAVGQYASSYNLYYFFVHAGPIWVYEVCAHVCVSVSLNVRID